MSSGVRSDKASPSLLGKVWVRKTRWKTFRNQEEQACKTRGISCETEGNRKRADLLKEGTCETDFE
jgi:hypothetical protein